jgi:hypothetical protein
MIIEDGKNGRGIIVGATGTGFVTGGLSYGRH